LSDAAKCRELSRLVLKGIRDSDLSAAMCFDPRHGLRVRTDAHTLDLVICFECLQIHAYGDVFAPSVTRDQVLTRAAVEPAVTKLFNEAGLTIAAR
jgi:hypothetical protein